MKYSWLVVLPMTLMTLNTYAASSFQQVKDVIYDVNFTPEAGVPSQEFSKYSSGELPVYPVNAASVFAGGSSQLKKDAQRTVSDREDYYDRIAKKLHPNGVCVLGTWSIDQPTDYTGYYANGSKGLFVGRISVAMGKTKSGQKRGFGFAGKIFPTMDESAAVETANFFTVDVLMGTKSRFFDVKTTNQPKLGFDFGLIGLGIRIASALTTADKDPGFRPLYPISEATVEDKQSAVGPKWMRLSTDESISGNSQVDFRDEVLQGLEDNGTLKFNIDASDVGSDNEDDQLWQRIGKIEITEAVTSYGCDRRLHFPHPKLKEE